MADSIGSIPRTLHRFIDWLTKPAAKLSALEDRQQARLLAATAVLMLSVCMVLLPAVLLTELVFVTQLQVIYGITVVLLLVSYGLSRSVRFQFGIGLMIFTVALFSIAGPLFYPALTIIGPVTLTMSVMLSSIFWDTRQTLLVTLIVLAALLFNVIISHHPEYTIADLEVIFFVVAVSGGILVWQRHYDHLRAARLAEKQREERRYKNLFDTVAIGLVRSTSDGILLDANPAFVTMLGFESKEELLDQNARSFYADKTRRMELVTTVETEQTVEDFISELILADGRHIWIEGNTRAVPYEDGTIYLESAIRDITPRKTAEQALHESLHRHQITNDILSAMTAGVELNVIVDRALHAMHTHFPHYRVAYINVESQGGLAYQASLDPPDMPVINHMTTQIDPSSQYIRSLLAGEIIESSDVESDPRFAPLKNLLITAHTRAALDVPLALGEDLIGVLSFHAADVHQWTPHEIGVLQEAGHLLGIAHQRAREEQHRKQAELAERDQRAFVEALQGINATLTSTLELDEVFDHIETFVRDVVPHEAFEGFMLRGNRAHRVRTHILNEVDSPHIQEALSFDIATTRNLLEVLETHRPVIVQDSHLYKGWVNRPRPNVRRSWLTAPIQMGDEVMGFLTVSHRQPDFFTERHAQRLQAFADLAALAIHNAQLHEAERRKRLEAETLRHTAEALAETVKLKETLDQMMYQLARLVAFRWGVVLLLEQDELRTVAVHAPRHELNGSALGTTIQLTDVPLFRQALNLGGIQLVRDHDLSRQFPFLNTVADFGGASILFPLVASDVVIGLLLVGSDQAFFSPSDAEMITTFGQQAAIAIRNAHFIEELERRVRELQTAQADLRRVERLKAAGELAAGIAHQINNPLTVVIGQTHMLMKKTSPEDDAYRSLDLIRGAANRAGDIVQRILNLSHEQQYEQHPVDLAESVDVAIQLVRGELDPMQMKLVVTGETDMPTIMGSASHLEDVWLNLLLNARDAVTQSGSYGIISIDLSYDKAEQTAVVRISNNGPVIPPDQIENLFIPFYTTKGQGTGLGLSICYDVVSRHGGTITVQSDEAHDTTFIVRLPVWAEHQPQSERYGGQ